MVKPASKVVTVSDVQFYVQAKLTEECVAQINEDYGRLEDMEGAIVILTSFRFGTIPRLSSGNAAPPDFAPDLCLIVHAMRLLGGVDNRMFGAPTAVSDEPAIRKHLSTLTLSQRRARAPFLVTLTARLLDAEIAAICAAGAPPTGERPKITFQSRTGDVALFVAVPNDLSDLRRDRQQCLPHISSQYAGSEHAPQWESSQATPGFVVEPCSASAEDGLSQLTGPAQYPWSSSMGVARESVPTVGVMQPPPIPSQDGEDEPLEPELLALAEQSRAIQRQHYGGIMLLSRPPASPVGVPATYQLPSSGNSDPQASGSPSVPSSTYSKDSPGDESMQLKVEVDAPMTNGGPTPVSQPHQHVLDPITPVSRPNRGGESPRRDDTQYEHDDYEVGASQFELTQPQYASDGDEDEDDVEVEGTEEETQLPVDAHQHDSLGFENMYNRESQSMSQAFATQEDGNPNTFMSQFACFVPSPAPVASSGQPVSRPAMPASSACVLNGNRPLQRPGDGTLDSQVLHTPSQVDPDVPLIDAAPPPPPTSSSYDESQVVVVPLGQVEITPPSNGGVVTSSGSADEPLPESPAIGSDQPRVQRHVPSPGSETETDDETGARSGAGLQAVDAAQFLVADVSSESQPSIPSQPSLPTMRRPQSPSASQLFGDEDTTDVHGNVQHRVIYVRRASHKRGFVGSLLSFLDQFPVRPRTAKK